MSASEPIERFETLCPQCGYDLRALQSDRCPECGLVVDRQALQNSAIAWAHRAELGRFRAFFKTHWQILRDAREIRFDAARPQSMSDARRFAVMNASCMALFLTALVVVVWLQAGEWLFRDKSIVSDFFLSGSMRGDPQWLVDVTATWMAGMVWQPVVYIACFAAPFALCMQHACFLGRGRAVAGVDGQDQALMLYAAAPLLLLMPAGLFGVLLAYFESRRTFDSSALINSFYICMSVFYFAGVFGTLLRCGQWHARIRRGGLLTGIVGALFVLGTWIVSVLVIVYAFPFVIGLIRIATISVFG
jgi:hypothetical protein